MYFDTLTLAAVTAELQQLVGGRIQRAVLPSPLSVALEVYAERRRFHLLLSANPQIPRVHLLSERPSRGIEYAPPLLLLLRKYVVGGRISSIEQAELERILVCSIVKGPALRNTADEDAFDGDDVDETLRSELVIEVMERRGNIILVNDANVILESVRHVTPQMSRRPVRPRDPYELPPRQNKFDPRRATPETLKSVILSRDQPHLSAALVNGYRGMSPQIAREIVFRTLGQSDTPVREDLPWDALAAAQLALWTDAPEPTLAFDEDGAVVAFAPYRLTHIPGGVEQPGMSAALDTFYARHERISKHQQRRDTLDGLLGETAERLERQRSQLAQELLQVNALEDLRWEGEMIYAFLHAIAPRQTELDVDGRMITLDPARTGAENARARFTAYDKAKSALINVPERLQMVEARLAGLEQLRTMLALADSFEQIEEIGREAVEQEYLKGDASRKLKGRRLPPLRVVSADGLTIYVGRSAGQNEEVTFRLAGSDDTWLHVRGLPGSHVIIKNGGAPVPEATLVQAAGLAAYYSKARNDTQVEVDVSRRRGVRRIPDAPPGLVSYHAEQTVRVAPRGHTAAY